MIKAKLPNCINALTCKLLQLFVSLIFHNSTALQTKTDKFHDIIGHVLFAVLALLALLFSWERLYVDAGYYLMRVINQESFWIEHQRLILIFPEWLPLLGVYLSLPIKWLVALYSIGHVLFFYAAYLISRYTFGNQWAGYQLALVQVLGLIEGFFVPVFELYYGCGLAVIYLSMLQSNQQGLKFTIISLLLFAFTLLSHPFMLFILAAIIGIKVIDEKKLSKYHLWMLLVAMSVLITKKLTQSIYEKYKAEGFIKGLKSLSYPLDYLNTAAEFMLTNYADVLAISLLFIVTLILSRKKLVSLAYLVSFLILAVFCNVLARDFNPGRYTEQVYYPIVALLILFIPFLPFNTLSKTHRNVILIAFLLVFAYRISLIVHKGRQFTMRIQTIHELCEGVQSLDGSKFIISEAKFDSLHTTTINWSLTLESLIYSASKPEMRTITICTDADYEGSLQEGRNPTKNQYLFRRWEMYEDNTLNNKYFKLNNGNYQTIEIETILGKHQ